MKTKILVFAIPIFLMGCESSIQDREESVFEVDISVDKASLLENGYVQSEDGMEFLKQEPDKIFSYDYLPETQVVYSRCVTVRNVKTDSFSLQNWLTTNDAFLASNWFTFKNGTRKAFVQHAHSGLIFTIFIKNERLIFVYFDFPDVGKQIRSTNREIRSDGTVVVKSAKYEISRSADLSD